MVQAPLPQRWPVKQPSRLSQCLDEHYIHQEVNDCTHLRKLLRSPYSMYSNSIMKGSPSVDTPWNMTMLSCRMLLSNSASLSNSRLESSPVSLRVFTATIFMSSWGCSPSHRPSHTRPNAPSPNSRTKWTLSRAMWRMAAVIVYILY